MSKVIKVSQVTGEYKINQNPKTLSFNDSDQQGESTFADDKGKKIILKKKKKVLSQAEKEAKNLSHNYVGTEHILLGLVKEGQGIAAKALNEKGINKENVKDKVI